MKSYRLYGLSNAKLKKVFNGRKKYHYHDSIENAIEFIEINIDHPNFRQFDQLMLLKYYEHPFDSDIKLVVNLDKGKDYTRIKNTVEI